MGKGAISSSGDNNRDAYLNMSIAVLATFCHVPEIISSEDLIFKIPVILEVISTQYNVFLFFRITYSNFHYRCVNESLSPYTFCSLFSQSTIVFPFLTDPLNQTCFTCTSGTKHVLFKEKREREGNSNRFFSGSHLKMLFNLL